MEMLVLEIYDMMRLMRSVLVILLEMTCILVNGEDPYLFHKWKVIYNTLSPFVVPQKYILINNQFPWPRINVTFNNNVNVNVFNELDKTLFSHEMVSNKGRTHGKKVPLVPIIQYLWEWITNIISRSRIKLVATITILPPTCIMLLVVIVPLLSLVVH